jgi:uncharacterized protein YxjI
MKLVMRQKLLALGDDYTVRDEEGRDRYYVDGRVLTIRDTLVIEDMEGRELARVRERIFAWGETWDVLRNGRTAAVVHKKLFTLVRCAFTIDVPGPDDLVAQGDLFDREYTFKRGSRQVAEVSKRWFTFTDTYGIDVDKDEEEVLILAAAIVIEQCCHEKAHGK